MTKNMNRHRIVRLMFLILLLQVNQAYAANSKPTNAITWWGDSLTAGAGGKGITAPAELSKLMKIPVFNKGVGGESSNEIAIRSGSKRITLQFWGRGITQGLWTIYKVVPSSNLLSQGNNVLGGNVGNCLAIMKFEAGNYTASVFKCKKSFANRNEEFQIAGLEQTNTKYQIIWSGRNNAGESATVVNDISEMIKRMKKINPSVKVYVLSIINGESEGLGSGAYSAITNLNSSLMDIDAKYVDIRGCLISEGLVLEKLTPSPQDLLDISNDLVPSQLRSDGIHLNAFGYHAVARCLYNSIKSTS